MDIYSILHSKFPGTEWTLLGNDYEGLEWLDKSPKPTQAELEKHWPAVEAELATVEIKNARQARYQSESDPIFFQWQRGERTEQNWLDAIAKIESDLPLPVAK